VITHPEFKYRISYRRVLDVQARILGAVLVGELPDYVAMVTR
jgi:CRISPR-associated protein Cas1